jgi:Tfp pilus assembly protein PilN
MRPVNLLPDDLRPRQASGALRGSSYAVVGVLGALFLMVVVYVLSANSVNSRTSDIAEAERQTQEAEARASALAPYEQFAQIKATRVSSVTALASQRFDWERTMREVALVLPAGTSLTELNATTAGVATGAAPAPTDPNLVAATSGAGPSLQLKGCAERQPDVATLMVRLRRLYRSSDVTLTESTKQAQAAVGGAPPAASSDSAAGGADGCPSDAYQFDMNVAFTPTDPGEKQKLQAPARLGGGA